MQTIGDFVTWMAGEQEHIANLIALVAVIISFYSLYRSSRIQQEQLRLEKFTAELARQQTIQLKRLQNETPALFLVELAGHLATLVRTLDGINPLWMHRARPGIFERADISHAGLHVICYESYVKDLQDLDTRIRLDNYYKEVLAFNARGAALQAGTGDELTVNYFVRGATTLIRTAMDLCQVLMKMMDDEVLSGDQLGCAIDNLAQQRGYYVTVCNASELDSASLAGLCRRLEQGERNEDIERKYPLPGYLLGLSQAAGQLG
ncbi:hypothetical protein [Zobellella endophytica]|nr:hypothetical protein [Zobellella endophytica]